MPRRPIIPQGFTAERLVTGEADLAVQQISELKQVAGIEVVGPIPHELQTPAVFSAGRMAASAKAAEADRLLRFLASPEVAPVLRRGRAGALNLPARRRNLLAMMNGLRLVLRCDACRWRWRRPWRMRNRPISCCATGWPPIPPIPTSRPTSRASPISRRPTSPPPSSSARRRPPSLAAGDVRARPRLCRQPADGRGDGRLAQGRRQGFDLGDGRARRALWHRRRRREGRGAGAQTVRARRRSRQSARRHQSRRARRRCRVLPIRRGRASCSARPPRPMRRRNISSA